MRLLDFSQKAINGLVEDTKNLLKVLLSTIIWVGHRQAFPSGHKTPHHIDFFVGEFEPNFQIVEVSKVIFVHSKDIVKIPEIGTVYLTATMIDMESVARCTTNGPLVGKLADMEVRSGSTVRFELIV